MREWIEYAKAYQAFSYNAIFKSKHIRVDIVQYIQKLNVDN